MQTIPNLWRHRCLRTAGSLLIATVLIAATVSCTPTPPVEYDLTMAENPIGGGTATDETGTSPYTEDTVVDIRAVPAPCYRFVDWTATAGTFGDPNAAETTFTMPAEDVTVTANFELTPPDHFKFYTVDYETAPYVGMEVTLVDQFDTFTATVGEPILFGNPVEKMHNDVVTPIADPNRHYTVYLLDYGEGEPIFSSWRVMVNNQFQDDVELTVTGPIALAVPTQKLEADLEAPECVNHYLIYSVLQTSFPEVSVHLKDQFIEEDVTVLEPVLFGNPVQKTVDGEVTDVEKEDEHLVFYWIEDVENASIEKTIQIENQFGPQTLDLIYRDTLAVPSQKISWEQPLDHFKMYWADWADEPPMYGESVLLEDQIVTLNATVYEPWYFANPTGKWRMVGEEEEVTVISNPNNHLTFYWIDYAEPFQNYMVQVSNQFGTDEWLRIAGPFWLAVPTQKGPHDPPAGLDHFLVYQVLQYDTVPLEQVYLWDQFDGQEVTVYEPYLFAIPAQKTHGDVLTPIQNPTDHLVFYYIDGGDYLAPELPIANQFGPQLLAVHQDPARDLLGVPSEKLNWAPYLP